MSATISPGWLAGIGARNGTPLSTTPAPTFRADEWGAAGDGVTDSTEAINSAIATLSALGGGVLAFTPGIYMASQITLKRFVILDGGSVGAVELKQIGGSNQDFIISEGFASLTGTNLFAPTTPSVPSWFGLKDLRVNGNNAGNSSGRGIAWYGNAQLMLGTVVVLDTAGDGIYTEAAASSAMTFPGLEPGFFETVFVYRPKGIGWRFRGPHDSAIKSYLCLLDGAGSYGWQNETLASTYSGVVDSIGQIHIYTYDDNTTNRLGVNIATPVNADYIYCDACSCVISAAATKINQLDVTLVGHRAAFDGLTVSANNVQIGRLTSGISAVATAGRTCVKWSGSHGFLGSAQLYGGSAVAATGLEDTGSFNIFLGLDITAFSPTGGVGLVLSAAGFCTYHGGLVDCKTAVNYPTATTQRLRCDLEVYTQAGQVAVAGQTPSSVERFSIRESGVQNAGTDNRVISSNAIAMDSTALQTVTLAHGCLYTPTARNVSLTFSTPTVTDFVWAIPPYFVSADATNLTIKCQLATASATAGSKGDVMAHVRMGA